MPETPDTPNTPNLPLPIEPTPTTTISVEVPAWAADAVRRLCSVLAGVDAMQGEESPLRITADGDEQKRNEVHMGIVAWGVPQTKIVDGKRKTGYVIGAIPLSDAAVCERPEVLFDLMPLFGATSGQVLASGGLFAIENATPEHLQRLLIAMNAAQQRATEHSNKVLSARLQQMKKLVIAKDMPAAPRLHIPGRND